MIAMFLDHVDDLIRAANGIADESCVIVTVAKMRNTSG